MMSTEHTKDPDTSQKSRTPEYQWYLGFDRLNYGKNMVRSSILLLAGPSGSGKSAIANALSTIDSSCLVLRNYTTRAARPTDHPGHFDYLSERDFLDAHAAHKFFLARLEPAPQYGYMAHDLSAAFAARMRPILMFRNAGTKYLTESIGAIPVVFIEGDPESIAAHSQNLISPPTVDDVKKTLDANRHLQEQMAQRHWPFLRITNHYDGEVELLSIAQRIKQFLHMQMDAEAVNHREISLSEPRYGVSLVAGRPFSQETLDSIQEVQSQLMLAAPNSVALPDPVHTHITIFRGRSSPLPCSFVSSPPKEVALAFEHTAPVSLAWSEFMLDSDGGIRAYATPRTFPFPSYAIASTATELLSQTYGVSITIQPRLWITVGMVKTTALGQDTLTRILGVLACYCLPKTTIAQLSLLSYRDLYLKDADILETYVLR